MQIKLTRVVLAGSEKSENFGFLGFQGEWGYELWGGREREKGTNCGVELYW